MIVVKPAKLTAVGLEKLGWPDLADRWVWVCGSGGEFSVWGLVGGDSPLLLEPEEDFIFSPFPPELHNRLWWETNCPDKYWAAWERDNWVVYDERVTPPSSLSDSMWLPIGCHAVCLKTLSGLRPWLGNREDSLFDRRWATAA